MCLLAVVFSDGKFVASLNFFKFGNSKNLSSGVIAAPRSFLQEDALSLVSQNAYLPLVLRFCLLSFHLNDSP